MISACRRQYLLGRILRSDYGPFKMWVGSGRVEEIRIRYRNERNDIDIYTDDVFFHICRQMRRLRTRRQKVVSIQLASTGQRPKTRANDCPLKLDFAAVS